MNQPVSLSLKQRLITPLLLSLLAACSGHSAETSQEKPAGVPVQLATVESGTLDDISEYVGYLESRRSVTLQPQVDGQVSEISVQAGDRVQQGTTLMRINPARQQASVSSVLAAAASSQAELENAKQVLRARAADRRSRLSDLKFQQQQYQRYSQLGKEGAVSQQEVDQYRNSYDAARAALEAIEADIRAQTASIARLERNVQQAQANINQQQVELQYYSISAPFTGTVGNIPAKVGDYVNQSTRLLTVTQNQPLEVNVSIPSEKSSQLETGMTIQLVDAQGKVVGNSKIFFISPNVNNQSQSVLVKSLYENPDERLRADQQVRARVIWSRRPGILIPTAAISRIAGQNFVFVAQEQDKSKLVAKQTPVKLGTIQGNSYQVVDGLQSGDRIVTSGILKLSNGTAIVPES